MKGNRYTYILIFITLALLGYKATVIAMDVDEIAVKIETAEAYSQPIPQLNDDERKLFQHGRSLVRQAWTIPPSEDMRTSGLGPLYNRISCIACHLGNGRGFAPDGPNETMKAMLVRLSVKAGVDSNATSPHPVYGDQLNEFGVPGVKGEGRAVVNYSEKRVVLADGVVVLLRKPHIAFKDLAYGALSDATLTSARVAPALYGLGLLESVDETEILRLAKSPKPDGIAGRPNYVWDELQKKTVVGKFGWKANMPNLQQQITSAFIGDLGITSTIYPNENCTVSQNECKSALSAAKPELANDQLEAITFYHTALAVPKPRIQSDQLGAQLFKQAKCVYCHVPELKISANASYAKFNNRLIKPYTDLLLHDMGDELADNRPDFLANGQEWRTPPLWGIGLAKVVNPKAGFLHDGRARSILEAILWHGGEAAVSAHAVSEMSAQEREALITFVESI